MQDPFHPVESTKCPPRLERPPSMLPALGQEPTKSLDNNLKTNGRKNRTCLSNDSISRKEVIMAEIKCFLSKLSKDASNCVLEQFDWL